MNEWVDGWMDGISDWRTFFLSLPRFQILSEVEWINYWWWSGGGGQLSSLPLRKWTKGSLYLFSFLQLEREHLLSSIHSTFDGRNSFFLPVLVFFSFPFSPPPRRCIQHMMRRFWMGLALTYSWSWRTFVWSSKQVLLLCVRGATKGRFVGGMRAARARGHRAKQSWATYGL